MTPLASSRPPEVFFSVIVPVRDGGRPFARTLDAIAGSTFRDFELIVVDDGSRDRSCELARRAGARLLRTPVPGSGPAAARNLGAAAARGEFLFFVDADCEPTAETLAQAAAVLRAETAVDAVFGSYDDAPAAAGFVAQYKNLMHHWTHQRGRPDASTFWAGCGAVRRARFLALGGFDARRYPRPSIEDIELGGRLRRAGARILLRPDIQVKHHKAWTLAGMVRSDVFDRALPWAELLLEQGDWRDDLNIDRRSRISVVASGLFWISWPLAIVSPWWLAMAAVSAVVLLGLNAPTYRFLARRRGVWFLLRALPLHWLYFTYSGGALGLAVARRTWRRLGRRPAEER